VREFAATVGARSIISEFDAYAERGEYEEWRKALDAVLRLRHPEPALVKYGTGMEERLSSYKHGFVKSKPVPTFSMKFNKLLLGGLDAGEMGVVLGLRGYGKSHILVALGASAVQAGKKVYHVSLEMGRRSVLRRYDTSLTGLPPKELAGQAGEQTKKLGASNLWVGSYPANTLSPSALRSMVSRRGRPDLLIVDYGRIMRPDFRTDTPYTQIGDIYAALRDIGIEFDCAVWTAGQVNRLGYGKQDSEGDVITLEQVAESIQIGDHADVVVSWNATRQEIHDHKGRLWVDKNREAEDKVMLHMEADWSLSRLKDE
jgi:replicative DNA helicase